MNEQNSPTAVLVDLLTVYIDKTQPVDDKKTDFIHQIGNHRHYKIGDVNITAILPSDAPLLTSIYKRLTA